MGFTDDSDNDLPDWLNGLGGEDEDQSPAQDSGEETPDWLSEIRQQNGEPADQPDPAPEDDSDNEAWLENIRQQAAGEFGNQPEPPEEQPQEDFMETIRSLQAEEDESVGDEEPTVTLKDYWKDREEKYPEPEPPQAEPEDVPAETEDVPDWVSGLPTMDSGEASDSPAATTPEDEDTPSWLQDIRGKEATQEPAAQEPGAEEPAAQKPVPDQPEIEQPASGQSKDDLPHEGAFTENPGVTSSLPSWMESLQTSGLKLPADEEEATPTERPEYSEEDLSNLFEDDDLPDWLGEDSSYSPQEPAIEGEPAPAVTPSPPVDAKIEKGELPGWLQAMRPVEAVTPDNEEEDEAEDLLFASEPERVGPLSGLSDVLPAEPDIIHFGSPARTIPGFELTDVQRKYAKVLETMVSEEVSAQPAARRSVANPQRILRWVIAILLLTIIFAAVWMSNIYMVVLPNPEGMPPQTRAAAEIVNGLPDGSKVLVAFEYQPGFSGEMEAASTALVRHLLERGSQLVIVSSQPIGPGLGETYLTEHFSDHPAISGKQYANLGYVSGGAAGLLSFAANPRLTKSEASWDAPPLSEIQAITDFALVLVLTDDPDNARGWIEQVQPLLAPGDIPLVMAVSAQAEPLIYPYSSASQAQVSGLVSGVSGGAYYENLVPAQTAHRYWSAYNVGLLLAVLIIAVGSIINLARRSIQGFSKGRP